MACVRPSKSSVAALRRSSTRARRSRTSMTPDAMLRAFSAMRFFWVSACCLSSRSALSAYRRASAKILPASSLASRTRSDVGAAGAAAVFSARAAVSCFCSSSTCCCRSWHFNCQMLAFFWDSRWVDWKEAVFFLMVSSCSSASRRLASAVSARWVAAANSAFRASMRLSAVPRSLRSSFSLDCNCCSWRLYSSSCCWASLASAFM